MPTKPRSTGAALVAALCKRYTLGHPEIDTQHRRIFEIVAQADEGKPAATIVDELYTYASDHFTAEERIAEDHNVDNEEHIKAHHDLLDMIAVYRLTPQKFTVEVRKFLVEWVTTHIDKEDRELVRSIQVGIRLQERMEHDE